MTISDAIVKRLLDWGVDAVFGLPGDGINGLMEALRKASDRMRYVQVRHEETAAMAASAYAKFTGRLGVCFSTVVQGLCICSTGSTTQRLTSRRFSPLPA